MTSRASEQQHSIDLLEDIIAGLFQGADVNQQGFLTRDDFIQVCILLYYAVTCVRVCVRARVCQKYPYVIMLLCDFIHSYLVASLRETWPFLI